MCFDSLLHYSVISSLYSSICLSMYVTCFAPQSIHAEKQSGRSVARSGLLSSKDLDRSRFILQTFSKRLSKGTYWVTLLKTICTVIICSVAICSVTSGPSPRGRLYQLIIWREKVNVNGNRFLHIYKSRIDVINHCHDRNL